MEIKIKISLRFASRLWRFNIETPWFKIENAKVIGINAIKRWINLRVKEFKHRSPKTNEKKRKQCFYIRTNQSKKKPIISKSKRRSNKTSLWLKILKNIIWRAKHLFW